MKRDYIDFRTPFSNLSLDQIERLDHFVEECGEALKEIGKISKWGFDSSNPNVPYSLTNRENLEIELSHVLLAIYRLSLCGDINFDIEKVLKTLPELWEAKKKYFPFQSYKDTILCE